MSKQSINNDLYLTLFNLSDDALMILDGEKFIHCNPACLRILKADDENMILDSHPADISPPIQPDGQNSWDKAKKQIALANKLGSHRFDWTHRRFNGEDFPAEVNLTVFQHNGKDLIYTVVRDISLWQSSQKALHDAENKLQMIATHTDDLIWTRDMKFRYTYLSPSVKRVKGWSVEEALKLKAFEVAPPEDIKKAITILREELQRENDPNVDKNRSRRFELREYCKDGSFIWTEQSMSFIRDSNNKPIGFFGITRNISDHKKTLNELRDAKKRAEESDNLKSAFLANMSHEIRTPLNAILGFSELMADERTDLEEREQFSDIIKESTRQLLSIISDIFDISKLNSDQLTIRPKPNNLQSVLKLVYSEFYNNFPEHYSECCRFILDPVPESFDRSYIFDEERLIQILYKLLDNACKFTDCGEISFGVKDLGNHKARFHVIDTGTGIPPEKQSIIFEHFRQADEDLRRQIGGTGLGLAISKGIIELMGGEIGVISNPGQGSEFWFTLPLVLPDSVG